MGAGSAPEKQIVSVERLRLPGTYCVQKNPEIQCWGLRGVGGVGAKYCDPLVISAEGTFC